ncbi:MAG: alginate export family protein [Kordiimonadaceae bacterium]|nr:alginate export family protein [Kordiimonadaceae bacterium]MBO6570261.1 alginate export family protein [Kordiimonadaceae bacterium]MBO6965641.1 alginate export family protein [Kordiimonadaceae bacterium]
MKMTNLTVASCLAAGALLSPSVSAQDADDDFWSKLKPYVDARLRNETVDQDSRPLDANSWTLRIRAGLELKLSDTTTIAGDLDWVEVLNNDFNSTINGRTQFPVVGDPQATELNRLYLTNTSIEDTKITIGRQRIIFDDARFVGNVGWRQNEQTYDAVRIENSSWGDVKIDTAYLRRVNRIFGPDSPAGRFRGDTFLLNVSKPTPIGKLTGFAYLVELEEALANSVQTYGGRLTGKTNVADDVSFAYAASFATQSEYQNNPIDFSTDYYFAEGVFGSNGFTGGAGYEVLTGNGTKGFATPLATLHKFQGFADLFLATPADGIEDLYFKAGWAGKNVGPFSSVRFVAAYHDFRAENVSLKYGTETNLLAVANWKNMTFLVKYADYNADGFGTDTTRLTIDFGIKF